MSETRGQIDLATEYQCLEFPGGQGEKENTEDGSIPFLSDNQAQDLIK